MQPLVTPLVVGVKQVLAFMTCEQVYCLLTALAAIVFAIGSLVLVCDVSGIKREYALLALFLIPETYACAYYPNSSTLAAVLFVWGLIFFRKGKWILAGILLCVAPLLRVDVVIVYPVLLPLLLLQGYDWKKSVGISALYAVAVVAIVALGCWVLQANPLKSLLGYSSMNDSKNFASAVKFAVFTFYTALGILLLPWGLGRMAKEKQYKLLFVCLLPMALLHFMFRYTGCATKHYLYLLPFVAVIYATALQAIRGQRSRVVKYAICGGIVLFLVVSIRVDLPSSPWRNEEKSEAHVGPVVELADYTYGSHHLRAGIGAGQLVPTLDEFMLATGNAFYPFYIYQYKKRKDSYRREAYELLKDKNYNLLMLSWGERSWYVNLLMEDGWKMVLDEPKQGDRLGKLVKGNRHITCYFTEEVGKNDDAGLQRVLNRHQNQGTTYIVEEIENMNYNLDKAAQKGMLVKETERCYLLK